MEIVDAHSILHFRYSRSFLCFLILQPWKGGRHTEANNNTRTMEDEISTDDDEPIRRYGVANRDFVHKYDESFLLNYCNFDSGALRTSDGNCCAPGGDGFSENHAILRSLSLNTALDDVEEMCQVCNYREKIGRNRRRAKPKKPRTFRKNEALIIFYLGLIDFVGFCSMSVMAPFFPKEVRFRCYINLNRISRRVNMCVQVVRKRLRM